MNQFNKDGLFFGMAFALLLLVQFSATKSVLAADSLSEQHKTQSLANNELTKKIIYHTIRKYLQSEIADLDRGYYRSKTRIDEDDDDGSAEASTQNFIEKRSQKKQDFLDRYLSELMHEFKKSNSK